MLEKIQSVVVSQAIIQKKVRELAKKISEDYNGEELVLIGVLKGGFVFLADLAREITIPVAIDFISVSSYGSSSKSSGVVRILKDIDIDISNKHLLLVEDLIDTGLTLSHLKELFRTRSPKSIKVCTILDKPSKRLIKLPVEYPGIEIPDKFVVGYGLDYAEKYRNLPEVYELLIQE
jgi:hypoxanthine phosphoribosyltransferase